MITLETVNDFLSKKKSIVRPMLWSPKLTRENPCWHQYDSAVTLDRTGEVVEDAMVRCMWQPAINERAGALNLGIFLGPHRIYAIDVAPLADHMNNKGGQGRPYWGQHVGGVHVHTWSADGTGYAEPLSGLDDTNYETAWKYFLIGTRLTCSHPFVHPDTGLNFGQAKLL